VHKISLKNGDESPPVQPLQEDWNKTTVIYLTTMINLERKASQTSV